MANKKINQLVSKTAILSTDIFGIGDATTGQLFKKTIAELQAAIGGAVISVNGLVGTVVLDTDDIQELATPTNKYFTDARARGAISLTVTGNSGASTYSSGTGVLNVPTYTLAGLGGITATFLSGTSGISYNSTTGVISYSGTVYTDASIRALFSGSTGITYNSSTGAISYSGTVYTDASVRALISLTTTGTSGASTYNNTTGVINVPNYTLAGLGGISLSSLSGGTGITYNNTTGAISYSGTVYTDASIRGLISLTTTGTSGASTYNSTTGVFNIPNYGSALSGYLPLTGGTLTGALSGTSASFSSTVIATGYVEGSFFQTGAVPATSGGVRLGTQVAIRARNVANTANIPLIESTASDGVSVSNGALILASTGAATFSSTLTSTDHSIKNSANAETLDLFLSPSTSNGFIDYPSGRSLTIRNKGSLSTFTLASTGAATFSNTVTSSLGSSGTSFNSNAATTGAVNAYRVSNTSGTGSYGIESNAGGELMTGGLSNATLLQSISNTALQFGTNQTARMTITSAGNVEIGAYVYARKGTSGVAFTTSNAVNADWTLETTSGGLTYLGTSGNVMAINKDGGNILIGTTSNNGEKLYISGNVRATGTITANSDITLKKNLLKIENALEKVDKINGYTYELKEDDSKRHAGVIAQEIQTVLPEIVNKGNDGILGVEYGNISALLIEAIKEQNTKIKNLETLLASK